MQQHRLAVQRPLILAALLHIGTNFAIISGCTTADAFAICDQPNSPKRWWACCYRGMAQQPYLRASTGNNSGETSVGAAVGFGLVPNTRKQQARKPSAKRKRRRKLMNKDSAAPKLDLNSEIASPAAASKAPRLLPSTGDMESTESKEDIESRILCSRIASADASTLIQEAAGGITENTDPLLVITTDASGGSGRFHGLCAILRQIAAAAMSIEEKDAIDEKDTCTDAVSIVSRRTRAVQQCTGKRKSRTRRSSRARRVGTGSVLGIPPEISAASLGIRAALDRIPRERRKQVLLLVDCERAINYLCDGLYDIDDAFGRALRAIADDTPSGTILISKVGSVSKSRYDGFFDHAAADFIAGMARGMPNTADDASTEGRVEGRCCPALQDADFEWLASSDADDNRLVNFINNGNISGNNNNASKSGSFAQDREDGRMRVARLSQRMEAELGYHISKGK